MAQEGWLIEEKAVHFERMLPGPMERVWSHLTEEAHLPLWFGGKGMRYEIEGREGGRVSLADGHIRGIVTQWKPPRILSFTWNVFEDGSEESPYPESFVTIELQSRDGSVLLALTHRPIAEAMQPFTLMGWHTFLGLLEALLRGEKLEDSQAAMERNARLYGASK